MDYFRKALTALFIYAVIGGVPAVGAEDAIRLPLKVGTVLLHKPLKVNIAGLITSRAQLGQSLVPTVMTIEDSKAGQLNVKYSAAVKYIKDNPVALYSTRMRPPVLEIPDGPVQIYDQYLQAQQLTPGEPATGLLNQILREHVQKKE